LRFESSPRFVTHRAAVADVFIVKAADLLRGRRRKEMHLMNGQGSTANVIAAVCSFFIPGLGQLVQGRPMKALVHCVIGFLLWLIFLGWIMHGWSALEAALWRPRYVSFGR
jgi:TM2 domain-containing membrane protein YozV